MMGDRCRQVSWLTALAPRSRLPAGCPAVALGAMLAAYSCGGSRGMEERPRTAFPFHPPSPLPTRAGTVTRVRSKQSTSAAVNGLPVLHRAI